MIYKENTIQELVNTNFAYQLLSDKLYIADSDHSKTFEQVCKEKNLNIHLVETLMKAYDDSYEFPYSELNEWSITGLVHYLQTSHTYYLQKKLPEIEQTAMEVFRTCYDSHPLFAYVCLFFTEYKKKIESHIRYEEEKLFPYIKELIEVSDQNSSLSFVSQALDSFSISVFIEEHSDIEEDLKKLRSILLKFSSGNKLPLPYKIFLNQLHYFELELNKHAIVEDEILIAKVIKLEEQLRERVIQMAGERF